MSKKRSKRLRKKLHLDEFKEFGFAISCTLRSELTTVEENNLLDRFLSEIIESRGLAYGGWVTKGYISQMDRRKINEEDRIAVESWLSGRPEYSNVFIGSLEDSWYPN